MNDSFKENSLPGKVKKRSSKFRKVQYFLLRNLGVPLATFLFALWRRTLRTRSLNYNYVQNLHDQGKNIIFAFWHGDLFIIAVRGFTETRKKTIYILSSKSRDGELLARFVEKLGFGTVRGSSSSGGTGALISLRERIQKGGNTAVAVDGPRGPRHVVKPGVVLLAKASGAVIVPVVTWARKKYTLKGSWDAATLPAPFSRCFVKFGEHVEVESDISRDQLNEKTAELETRLKKMKESLQLQK